MVGAIRGREVPTLLALIGDGVGSSDDVELVVIDQRTASLGRDVGELAQLLLDGLLVGNTQDGSGDLVAKVDLETLVLLGLGIQVAIAQNVLLDAALKLTALLDGGDLRIAAGARALATGTAASKRTHAGNAQNAQTGYLQKLTTRHIHCWYPFPAIRTSWQRMQPWRRTHTRHISMRRLYRMRKQTSGESCPRTHGNADSRDSQRNDRACPLPESGHRP